LTAAASTSGIVLFLVCGALYFIPTLLAAARGHQSGLGIFILNVAFGWTVLGWIIALIWACSGVVRASDSIGRIRVERPDKRDREMKCPHCAERIKAAATVCRFCDRSVI
jgi:hypothetical protein